MAWKGIDEIISDYNLLSETRNVFLQKRFCSFYVEHRTASKRERAKRKRCVRRDLIESLPSAPTASTVGCLGTESYAAPSPDPTTPLAEGKRYYYTRCTVLKIYRAKMFTDKQKKKKKKKKHQNLTPGQVEFHPNLDQPASTELPH